MTTLQNIIVDEPEAARQKRTFALGQPIAGIVAFVSDHEFAIDQQFSLDRLKRSLDAWVSRR
jgi:hypothetical protein